MNFSTRSVSRPSRSTHGTRHSLVLEPTRWVSLGRACRLLGVNESTLRRWADSGQVRSYRTPGGHRRFSENDLVALTGSGPRRANDAYGSLGDIALARIRRNLHRGDIADQAWFRLAVDEEGRERLRALGRRLIELVPDYLSRRGRRARAQAEAKEIGAQYGEELGGIGLSSRDAVQAFTFFRRALVDAAKQFAAQREMTADAAAEAAEQVVALADEVLLALLESFEATDETRQPTPAAR